MKDLAARITAMARSVQDTQRFGTSLPWPAWSTSETLMVALVLNNADRLEAAGYTMVEAFDRVDLTAAELRQIERELQS